MKFSLIPLVVLTVFFSLTVVELETVVFHPDFVYWRAWEKASNIKSKDANFAPFKPFSVFNGKIYGDLINLADLVPQKDEFRSQTFVVDESGYRNEPHFIQRGIDAVIIGSSFVTGAAFDQKDVISQVLTDTYNLRTYNFYGSLQTFWEDKRFEQHKPRYVIFLGSEGEVFSSLWRIQIVQREPVHHFVEYDSFQDWQKQNDETLKNFENVKEYLKIHSITASLANSIETHVANFHKTKKQRIAEIPNSPIVYDEESDMLYYQPKSDNPVLGSEGKTEKDITDAIKVLNQSASLLAKRGIILVVVGFPSKSHIELPEYKNLEIEKRALYVFNQKSKNQKYINVDMLQPSLWYKTTVGGNLYFKDDSHWNIKANTLIAGEIMKALGEE